MVSLSSAAAPSSTYAEQTIKPFVEAQNMTQPVNWTTNWRTEVQNNYVGLEVILQSSLVDNFTDQPSAGAVDTLSNVGGQTGLWIGISFLSVMEFVEMLYRLARHQFRLMT